MKKLRSLLLFIAVVGVLFLTLGNLATTPPIQENDTVEDNNLSQEQTMSEITELKIKTLVEGTGEESKAGDTLSVHYTGTLTDGSKFDSSVDRGTPFEFVLGAGLVIQGWDQGMAGMKVGEKRTLTIPADLGYGDNAVGSIPAGSTLIFEVELLEIK